MASQDDIRREKELLSEVEARAGVESGILSDLRDQSNVVIDQLQNFKFQRAEKTEIRNLTREINKIASSNYDISLRELGSQKQLQKLNKDKEAILLKIGRLQELSNKFSEINTKKAKEFVLALKDQIRFSLDLLNNIEMVEKSSLAIANSGMVSTFQGAANLLSNIPGLTGITKAFQNAADVTRQAKATESITKSLFETGKGLTKNKIKELGLEKELGNLTGTAAATKAKSLGLSKKILN